MSICVAGVVAGMSAHAGLVAALRAPNYSSHCEAVTSMECSMTLFGLWI